MQGVAKPRGPAGRLDLPPPPGYTILTAPRAQRPVGARVRTSRQL